MREVLDIGRRRKIAMRLWWWDIAAVVLLFSPLVGSERSRRQQLDQLWQELQRKTMRRNRSRTSTKRSPWPAIRLMTSTRPGCLARLCDLRRTGKVAKQNGVRIGQIRSKAKDTDPIGLRPWRSMRISRETISNWCASSTRWSATRYFLLSTALSWGESRREWFACN